MNSKLRAFHRWMSMAFTLAVIANIIAMVIQKQPVWVGVMALVPLALLMITGLYMFAQHYARRAPKGH